VIVRLAQKEAESASNPSYPLPKAQLPKEPRTEPDQIKELMRILDESGEAHADGPALPPRPKDHWRRKLTPRR
jgi:hypothetical protein